MHEVHDAGPRAPFGLRTAARMMRRTPRDPRLAFIRGRNAELVRSVAHLVLVMCAGTPGTRLYLGSPSVARVLGSSQRAVHRAMQALERSGVLVRIRTGGLCIRSDTGDEYDDGRLVPRGSEYLFTGLDALTSV